MNKLTPSLMLAVLAVFALSACQKKEIVHKETRPKAVNIVFSLTAGATCGLSTPCQDGVGWPTRVNRITLVKDALTVSYYPNLRYSYYTKGAEINPGQFQYNRVAQVVCNSNSLSLSRTSLDDNTRCFVLANLPTGTAPGTTLLLQGEDYIIDYDSAWGSSGVGFVTTGDYEGDSCF